MARAIAKRRWFSFSIRTLLFLASVICVACGWLGLRLRQASRQSSTVSAIENLGGTVTYEYQEKNWSEPSGPTWLRQLLGPHFFDKAVHVSFSDAGKSNDRVDDASCLLGLDHLEILHLDRTGVRDISALKEMKHLKFLSLDHTHVVDLSPLQNLPNLDALSLARTSVSDLTPLKELHLRRLWLDGTLVDDISALAPDHLIFLSLYKTKVSDISRLSSATELETLNLNWTGVADVSPLIGLRSLASLDLGRTSVTDASVVALKRSLPDCQIVRP